MENSMVRTRLEPGAVLTIDSTFFIRTVRCGKINFRRKGDEAWDMLHADTPFVIVAKQSVWDVVLQTKYSVNEILSLVTSGIGGHYINHRKELEETKTISGYLLVQNNQFFWITKAELEYLYDKHCCPYLVLGL